MKRLISILIGLFLAGLLTVNFMAFGSGKFSRYLTEGSRSLVRLSMIEQKQFLRLELNTAMRGLYQPLVREMMIQRSSTSSHRQMADWLAKRPEISISFLLGKDGCLIQLPREVDRTSLDTTFSKHLKAWTEGKLPLLNDRFFGGQGKWINLNTTSGARDGLLLLPLATDLSKDTAICIVFEPTWLVERLPSLLDSVRQNWMTFIWKAGRRGKDYDLGFGVYSAKDTIYWWGDTQPTPKDESYNSDAVSITDVTIAPAFKLGVIFGEKQFYNTVSRSSKAFLALILVNSFGLFTVIVLSMILIKMARRLSRRNQIALGHLAHSVKTPVARLQLAADILEEGQVSSPDEEHKIIQTVSSECRQLRRAVENAALSLEGGKIAIHKEPGDLAALVRETADAWKQSFDQAGIRLVVEGVEKPLQVLFDRDKLRLALDNLIDNALRHTYLNLKNLKPEDAVVTAVLRSESKSISLSVCDSGAGIPKSDMKNVFKRFSRSRKDPLTGVSGLGLGLALVKEIVEGHGGKVRVEGTGNGARFLIEIPK